MSQISDKTIINTQNNDDEIFDTKEKKRCRDCICLVEDDNGEWICDEMEKDIHLIENCPEGLDCE